MKRQIIEIDEDRCNGCGLCANACHEGALAIVDGKAKLLRDDYCDGLGNCLPVCPQNAIRFIEREAASYDEKAAKAAKLTREAVEKVKAAKKADAPAPDRLACGCKGSMAKEVSHKDSPAVSDATPISRLSQWPVQIKLVPINAPYFAGSDLLVAADCTAYAYAGIHEDFIKGRVTLIGCPKLDNINYAEKLTDILMENDIRTITVLRMEVPCCGGMEYAVKTAVQQSGKDIPVRIVIVSPDGALTEED